METNGFSNCLYVGDWRVTPSAGRLARGTEERAVEPKVMDLLVLLASRPSEVFSHEEISASLWPDTIVGDDTLARCVSKLRKAFEDDAKTPAYVETIAKRGYRLIAAVNAAPASSASPRAAPPPWRRLALGIGVLVLLGLGVVFLRPPPTPADAGATLIARAKDYYFQYTRADNEAAITLYERVLGADPDNADALAGLATALVQRVLRWPNPPGGADYTRTTLGEALAQGRTETPQARALLARARGLATRAIGTAPNDAFAHQAFGLAAAASRDFDVAENAYERALALDPNAWGALINLGDLQDIRGQPAAALMFYEQAYAAMGRVYDAEPQRVRLWYAEVGVLIARRHGDAGRGDEAETWYRRVLSQSPLHAGAIVGLATLLHARGDAAGAAQLCATLAESTGANAACTDFAL